MTKRLPKALGKLGMIIMSQIVDSKKQDLANVIFHAMKIAVWSVIPKQKDKE